MTNSVLTHPNSNINLMNRSILKKIRKFKNKEFYQSSNKEYYLLPFRFHRINDEKEVLVNEVGDFLIVPNGTATKIVNRDLSIEDPLYPDFFANFFISNNEDIILYSFSWYKSLYFRHSNLTYGINLMFQIVTSSR